MSISANPSPAELEKAAHKEAMDGLIDAVFDAMNSNTVANLAKNASGLAALADRFTSPEMMALLEAVLANLSNFTVIVNLVGKMVENGALDKVVGLLDFLRAVLDSAGSPLVTSVMNNMVNLVALLDQVTTSSVMGLVPSAIAAVDEAIKETAQAGDAKIKDLIKLARDPHTLANLKFVLLIMQKLSVGSASA